MRRLYIFATLPIDFWLLCVLRDCELVCIFSASYYLAIVVLRISAC